MAALIRSARIAIQRRLLSDGIPSSHKGEEMPEIAVGRQPHIDEEAMRREADRYASTQAMVKLEEALRVSQARTEQTEAELQRLLSDIENLRQDAVASGTESGYQAGHAEGSDEIDRRVERLARLSDQLFKAKEDALVAAEAEMVEVVFASVAKILGDAFVGADAVVAAVRQSIKQLVNRDHLVIHLSTEDMRLLEEVASGREEELFGTRVEIVADERIELGGCLLQTRSGGLDARLEVQMRQLRDCLLDVAARRQEERPP
jgi:flagellar assembly protein FliH